MTKIRIDYQHMAELTAICIPLKDMIVDCKLAEKKGRFWRAYVELDITKGRITLAKTRAKKTYRSCKKPESVVK